MKIAFYTRQATPEAISILGELTRLVHDRGGHVHWHTSMGNRPAEAQPFQQLNGEDALICIGGDGTILESVSLGALNGIPVLGVNTGRLGFLANTTPERAKEALKLVMEGRYWLEERSLLNLETSVPLFGDHSVAVNDFVVHKKDTSSMITVHTFLNGEFLTSYWADGLIVATPTGSTGYSLSCGGPILTPTNKSLVITPVSPHNLNMRPMVVSDDQVISFEVEGRGTNFLVSLDSRSETIDSSVQLAVKKAPVGLKLIQFHDDHFLQTLQQKLNWGIDRRK